MATRKQADKYADRVAAVEAEGATTSDAQAVVDAEEMIAASRAKKDAKPAATGKVAKRGKAAARRNRKPADSLPNRVRALREAAELSPKDLAAQIGTDWTASTVRRIERGARVATPQQVAQLADALSVPVADLGFTLPTAPVEPQAKPAAKPVAKGKVVGKRTGKVLATKQDVKDEIGAILA